MLAILFGCQQNHLGNFDEGHLGELFLISASSSGDVHIKILFCLALAASAMEQFGQFW